MYTNIVKIPEGVEVQKQEHTVTVRGPEGENSRELRHPWVEIEIEGDEIKLSTGVKGKRGKMIVNTFASHLRNLIKGTKEKYTYKLKIVFSHFPINVKISGNDVIIENFFGERAPRKTKIMDGVQASIEGDTIIIQGTDKEKTAQSAANIEMATRRSGYDKRRFQDGIYIVEKAGESV